MDKKSGVKLRKINKYIEGASPELGQCLKQFTV